jgi:hypothetical protein
MANRVTTRADDEMLLRAIALHETGMSCYRITRGGHWRRSWRALSVAIQRVERDYAASLVSDMTVGLTKTE